MSTQFPVSDHVKTRGVVYFARLVAVMPMQPIRTIGPTAQTDKSGM